MARKKQGVVGAVERELKALAERAPDVADSAVAASALALAGLLDDAGNSATSRAACAKELREAMDRLRELAPAKKENDRLDDLSRRRAARIARGAGA